MTFVIQKRAIANDIWFEPDKDSLFKGQTRASSVSELRAVIELNADVTTLDWRQHFRIITTDGKPVARFVIRPGRVRETRTRY